MRINTIQGRTTENTQYAKERSFIGSLGDGNLMRRSVIGLRLLTLGLLALVIGACGGGGGGGGEIASVETAPVTLSISIPTSLPQNGLGKALQAPAPIAVNSIFVEIIGPGVATTTRLLVRGTDFFATTTTVTVTIEVPVGTDRTITARAYAASNGIGIPLYQGSTTGVTLISGLNRVDLVLFVPPFAVPTITSFTPTTGCTGISVTITGTNFDPIVANNSVRFPGISFDTFLNAQVTNPSPTSLTVLVPNGAFTGPIRVANLLGFVTSATSFTVTSCSESSFSFATRLNLSNNAGVSSNPAVAITGDTVVVAWQDNTPGNNEILLKRSTDGGVTFGTSTNLSNSEGHSVNPVVAITGNTVLVAWEDRITNSGNSEILLARSTDGGANFGARVNLSSNTGDSSRPAVAITGSTVVVAWDDTTSLSEFNADILLKRSTDGGVNFGAPVNLSNNTGTSFATAVAITDSTVLVAWDDNTPGNYDILLARIESPFESPTIASFTPTSGYQGISVTITGTNFDPISANNSAIFLGTVTNDARVAQVTEASPTSLTVLVPTFAVSGPIRVANLLESATSVTSFTVITSTTVSLSVEAVGKPPKVLNGVRKCSFF